jgi:hypothetical protein
VDIALIPAGQGHLTLRGEKRRRYEVSFFIAMQNRRGVASFWHPQSIVSESDEFLIVSRSGGRNELLCISSAGASSGIETEAPTGLRPGLCMVATLVSQGPDRGEIFLVERARPEGVDINGRFIGGDGYLILTEGADHVTLRGSARIRSDTRTAAVLGHCVFFANDEPGATVHFDARYLPWVNEILPNGFAADSARKGLR